MILESISKKTETKKYEIIDISSEDILTMYNLTRQDFSYRDYYIFFESAEEEELYFDIFKDNNLTKIDETKYRVREFKKKKILTENGRLVILTLNRILNFGLKNQKNINVYHCSDFLKLKIKLSSYEISISYDWEFNIIKESVRSVDEIELPMEEYIEIRRELQRVMTNFRYYNV